MTPSDLKELIRRAEDHGDGSRAALMDMDSALGAVQDILGGDLRKEIAELWDACNTPITSWGGLETSMLDSPRILAALKAFNQAASAIKA